MPRGSGQKVIRHGGRKTAYFDTQKQRFVIKCILVPRGDSFTSASAANHLPAGSFARGPNIWKSLSAK